LWFLEQKITYSISLNGIAALIVYLTAPYPGAWLGGDE